MLGKARKRRKAFPLSLLLTEGSYQPTVVTFQLVLAKLVHQSIFYKWMEYTADVSEYGVRD